ncbi:hypothetical protein FHS95_000150 [Sphingomonas naasensis]|nr:hypothetical protein [Sphingomonas naasensis]
MRKGCQLRAGKYSLLGRMGVHSRKLSSPGLATKRKCR